MRTKIIAAFPGVGKSHFAAANPDTVLDSDSSAYSWCEIDGKKQRNPYFPGNYMQHIQDAIGKYEYILVSTHKEVREALLDRCIFFHLIFPPVGMKGDYIQRYRTRGSPESFVALIDKNWEAWLQELHECDTGCRIVVTTDYLSQRIPFL